MEAQQEVGPSWVDYGTDQREDIFSVDAWNRRRWRILEHYLTNTYPRESLENHAEYLLDRPYVCKSIIHNWTTNDDEKWDLLVQGVGGRRPASRIVYVVGDIDQGKTTTAYDLLHDVHQYSGRPICALGEPAAVPDFVDYVDNIQQLPRGAIGVLDEAAQNASARRSMTIDNKTLSDAIPTIRHNDNVLVIISQTTAMADPNLARLVGTFIFKPVPLASSMMERSLLKRIMRTWHEMMPRHRSETFILSRRLPPLKVKRPAPGWYTQSMSEAFRPFQTWEEVMGVAVKMRRNGKSWAAISRRIALRWDYRHEDTWKRWVLAHCGGQDPRDERTNGEMLPWAET